MIPQGRKNTVPESSGLPDVTPAVDMLFQPIKVGLIQSSQVDGLTQEVVIWKYSKGVIQPFTSQQLAIRGEGERGWQWYTIHTEPTIRLVPDDLIMVKGLRLRVMEKLDYTEYGFLEFHAIEAFTPEEIRTVTP